MTSVLLYWNHICVLHKHEKLFLDQMVESLRKNDIELTVRCFGLGYPEHMSEYLARPEAILPDIIVSSDLEVFEDRRIFNKFRNDLYPATQWLPLKQDTATTAALRDEKLLPFLSIPLVYYTSNPTESVGKSICEQKSLAFGGINNSAGKTITKAVWSRYGKAAARRLLETAEIADMPIGGFQQVRTGKRTMALVPSLYALRADGQSTFLQMPLEGPTLISSYFCVRNSISASVAKILTETILCKELCTFYAENGDLIVHPDCITHRSQQDNAIYFVPDKDWYETVSPEEFYDLYCEALPTAKRPL